MSVLRKGLLLLFMGILVIVSGCSHSKVIPQEQSKGNGTISQYATDYNNFVNAIKAKGYQVKEIKSQVGSHSFFSVTPKAIKINDEFVTVYEFANNDTAQSQAKTISSDGSKIGNAIIDWVSVPHFYLQGKIIVSYIGRNSAILSVLEEIVGKPITYM